MQGGDFGTPEDTDGDGTPDYLDSDSDTDGPLDNPSSDLDNQGGDTTEVGYRESYADLVTVKTLTSGDATPSEGDTVTFQIVVDNDGASLATNVSLTDLLPVGLTVTVNNGTVSQGSYIAGTGVWTVGTLASGSSATLTLEGTVDAGEVGNTINNVTTAATGDQSDPTTAGDDLGESVQVQNDPPVVVDPDPTLGTPSIDPLDAELFSRSAGNMGFILTFYNHVLWAWVGS